MYDTIRVMDHSDHVYLLRPANFPQGGTHADFGESFSKLRLLGKSSHRSFRKIFVWLWYSGCEINFLASLKMG